MLGTLLILRAMNGPTPMSPYSSWIPFPTRRPPIGRLLTAVVVGRLLPSSPASAGTEPPLPTSPPDPIAVVDSLVQAHRGARRIPGVSVAVLQNGELRLESAYGVASTRTGRPLSPTTPFMIASITKIVTDLARVFLR